MVLQENEKCRQRTSGDASRVREKSKEVYANKCEYVRERLESKHGLKNVIWYHRVHKIDEVRERN